MEWTTEKRKDSATGGVFFFKNYRVRGRTAMKKKNTRYGSAFSSFFFKQGGIL